MAILPSYTGGGAERVLLNFIVNAKNKKIEYKLFVANATGPLKNNSFKEKIEFKYKRFLISVPSLLKEIKKNKIDILISTFPHTSVTILLLKAIKIINCKIIIRQPNMIEVSLSRTKKLKILKYFYKKTIRYADTLIVTSEEMRKESTKFKIMKNRVFLLKNPININTMRKGLVPKRKRNTRVNLVFVGRLAYQKGLDRILYSIKQANNVYLAIIGEGEEKSNLERTVNTFKIQKRVDFLGYIERPFELIAGADYFILPSRWEGLPNSALESLALGTPVIAFSDVVALKDYKKNISNKSITILDSTTQLNDKLKILYRRVDYKKPKLRKNLLHNSLSIKQYQNKLNKIIMNV